ncbi:MAG: hypothetical protein EON61_03675 [Alphaproteobacteria bacterium]|jgi:hypothetical protein|nr:MAG: hypothetical protein EON61_03675 [Alphaproteobacteria bacterium]
MSDNNSNASGSARQLGKKIIGLLVGLVITLIVGAIAERVTDAEWLAQAKVAQDQWIDAVYKTSPINVATTFWMELQGSLSGDTSQGAYSAVGAPDGHGLSSPVYALVFTALQLWESSGIAALIQLAMGALAFAAFNFWRTKGETIFIGEFWLTLILAPLGIIALASVIGLVLWALMIGALYALSSITGLAATAAGATGVVGFCWLCITELTKKGAEHVITPKGLG